MTDAILQRIADGDQEAVSECIERYSGLVWSLSRRFMRNDADVEDAVQEIFMELWSTAGRFDPAQASETTFIAMVARRRLIDRHRKSSRRPEHRPIDEHENALSDDGQRLLENSAETERVARVIATLNPEQQEVINLSSWLGMSHKAISEQTGLPLGTVKSYIRRGLLAVREALGESGKQPDRASL